MQLFQYVAIKLIADAGQLLQAKIQNEKMPQRVAWNATTVELVSGAFLSDICADIVPDVVNYL
jgi:hypothetical protein